MTSRQSKRRTERRQAHVEKTRHGSSFGQVALGTGIGVGAALAMAAPAAAADFTVTNLDALGPGSLANAIAETNTSPGPDRVLFQSGLTGTISPSDPMISDGGDLEIVGPGAKTITVKGDDSFPLVLVGNPAEPTPGAFSVSGLTLRDGSGSYGGNTVGRLDGHRSAKATACPGDVWWPFIGTNYSGGEARNAINARINGTGGPSTITVDNSSGGFSASANWSTGSSATDKFGADYRFRPTEAISDRASWTGTLPAAGSYSISAWWTEGTNRSANVSYTLPDASTVAVNQQANGGKWNLLANKSLSSGANTVYLSCWATTGFVAVADAVRFVGPN